MHMYLQLHCWGPSISRNFIRPIGAKQNVQNASFTSISMCRYRVIWKHTCTLYHNQLFFIKETKIDKILSEACSTEQAIAKICYTSNTNLSEHSQALSLLNTPLVFVVSDYHGQMAVVYRRVSWQSPCYCPYWNHNDEIPADFLCIPRDS